MIREHNKALKSLIGSVSLLTLVGCATNSTYTSTNYDDNGRTPQLVQPPLSQRQTNDQTNGRRTANQPYTNRSNPNQTSGNNGSHKPIIRNGNSTTNPTTRNIQNGHNQPYTNGSQGNKVGIAPSTKHYTSKAPKNSTASPKVPKNTDVGNIEFDGYKYAGLLPSGKGAYYKVGKPYTIKGYHYSPHEDYGYNVVGPASWYGPGFQGGKTANGERFDTNTLAAASPILPLPSYVRVTNLSNGKQVIVRVNDRGPYASTRIMDLSKKAAEILDYKNKGTTTVRVEILAEESKALKALLLGKKGVNRKGTGSYKMSMGNPKKQVTKLLSDSNKPVPADNKPVSTDNQPVPADNKPVPADNKPVPADNKPVSTNNQPVPAENQPVTINNQPIQADTKPSQHPIQIIATSSDYSDSKTKAGNYYIQVGAYATEEKVRSIEKAIGKNMNRNMDLTKITMNGQDLYRIRFNNIKSEDKARHLSDKLMDLGYKDPKITLQK